MLKKLLTKFNEANKSSEFIDCMEARGGVSIAAHPFYELIVYKRNSFQNEFLNPYDRLNNLYIHRELKISSYLELRYL